jgi:hypothetical protein
MHSLQVHRVSVVLGRKVIKCTYRIRTTLEKE